MKGIVYISTNINQYSEHYGMKYVGRDKNNNPSYVGSGSEFKKDLKELGKESFKKQILQDGLKNMEDLNEAERYWIQYFQAHQSTLFYNINTGGGRGYDVNNHPNKEDILKRSKAKHAQTLKDNPEIVEAMTERIKRTHFNSEIKIRRAATRKQTMLENPGVMSRAGKQVYIDNPDKNAQLRKSVLCYTLDGKFYKKFVSVSAASKELGFSFSMINFILKGKSKRCGKYMFRELKRGRIIKQIDSYATMFTTDKAWNIACTKLRKENIIGYVS